MNIQPHYINDNTLIQLLRSDKPDANDQALHYIIMNKQNNITSKLRMPTHISEDEMFNHALFELWKYVRKHDFDTSKKDAIERFLYTVCKRYIIRNSGSGDANIDVFPELADYALYSTTKREMSLLIKIFDRLGVGCKEILTLRYFDELKYKEISERTNYTAESARVKYSNCISKLKKWINEDGDLAQYIRNLLTE